MKRALILTSIILLFLATTLAFAQTPEITNGLNYLQSTQSPEGYWGDVSEVPYNSFVDTCAVVETLNYLNEIGTAYNSAIQWINSTEVSNNDYLFTKMLVLSQAGFDVSTSRDYLISVINDDSGWGVAEGSGSDIKRTTLALLALNEINYSDLDTINYALDYLTSNQNPDGGWAFRQAQGDETFDSNVYMSALVLKSLALYKGTFDLQSSIDSAVSYLLTEQNPDGGISSDTSTVFETAIAFDALIESGNDPSTGSGQAFQNAIDYLINNQLPNGSWDDDPYSTALALRALASVKPNLYISRDDIAFSNPTPAVGETITITATIHNNGIAQAPSTGSGYITVQFYDGDPENGGVQIDADRLIENIGPYSSASEAVMYQGDSATLHNIFVTIDPLHTIEELRDSDNTAIKNITFSSSPDLFVDTSQALIVPANPTPDSLLKIFFNVRNLGDQEAENVLIRLYKGIPGYGGVVLSETIIPELDGRAGHLGLVRIEHVPEGLNSYYILVDPENEIIESDESNNTGSINVMVGSSELTDLQITPNNISFSMPADAQAGDSFSINALVLNTGSTDITTEVGFYSGDPDFGGAFIATKTITVPAVANQIAQAEWVLPQDNALMYVKVDPNNAVDETNESNNMAYKAIEPYSSLPDIEVHDEGITYYPSNPTPRSIITIASRVFNNGGTSAYTYLKLYDGAPEDGGVRKSIFSFSENQYLAPYSHDIGTATVKYLPLGEHEYYVIADPDNYVEELYETNNRGIIKITITDDAKSDLYISGDDITFSPALPLEGEPVTIRANVHNSGSERLSEYYVAFYNGDPLNGGQLIGRVDHWVHQEGRRTASINFTMTGGIPDIYVVLDDDNQILETNEENNTAHRTVDTYRVDLSVSPGDISLAPVFPEDGDMVDVNVMIHSAGMMESSGTLRLYDGDVESGVLIGSQDFVTNENQSITLNFPSYSYPGDGAALSAVIDNITPTDDDLTNNRATVIFGEHIEDGASNEGTDFWIAWPDVFYLKAKIVIQSKYDANVTVEAPSFVWRGNVSPGFPAVIPMRDYKKDNILSDGIIEDKGIHITSDRDISVIFHTPIVAEHADDSYLALPTNILGTEYYFLSYTAWGHFYPSLYVIVSTENNTNVDINGSLINLNRGQTYQVKQDAVDHSGTHIRSDKPVVFIAGTKCSNITKVPFIKSCDSLLEEMLPVSLLGTDYYTAPLYSPGSPDVFRILATEDNTGITIKDKYEENISLNAGEWTEYERETETHIISDKPIMVAQFAKGKFAATVGDPFQMTIIPTDKLRTEYRFFTDFNYTDGNYLTVIAPEPETTVKLDGGVLETGWAPLPDKGNFLVMSVTEGEHVITSDKPVAVYSHGYRWHGSYG